MTAPLPARNGVGPSCVWLEAGPWKTVMEFLVHRFPAIGRDMWTARMLTGNVMDEFGNRIAPEDVYRSGVRLYYYRELEDELSIPFQESLLYRDEHLLVVDKPHFLPVVPSGRFLQETLLVRLKNKLGLDGLAPIHRLDRETAGLVLFSVTPETRGLYQSLFHRREVEKTYHALARYLPQEQFPLTRCSRLVEGDAFFLMKEAAGEPNSETRVEMLETRGDIGLYRLTPVTGRKHQLRVHMASLGAPILNDAFYPTLAPIADDDYSRPLQLLAKQIAFIDPIVGVERRFESSRTL